MSIKIVLFNSDEDNDGKYSIGDGFGGGEWFEQQQSNEVNLDINQELTATIEGEVSCDAYTSGLVNVAAFDEVTPSTPPSNIANFIILNEEKKGYYKISLFDVPLGSKIWVSGLWDVDETYTPTSCDYMGVYPGSPFTLEEEVITGIDLNGCELQIPCID